MTQKGVFHTTLFLRKAGSLVLLLCGLLGEARAQGYSQASRGPGAAVAPTQGAETEELKDGIHFKDEAFDPPTQVDYLRHGQANLIMQTAYEREKLDQIMAWDGKDSKQEKVVRNLMGGFCGTEGTEACRKRFYRFSSPRLAKLKERMEQNDDNISSHAGTKVVNGKVENSGGVFDLSQTRGARGAIQKNGKFSGKKAPIYVPTFDNLYAEYQQGDTFFLNSIRDGGPEGQNELASLPEDDAGLEDALHKYWEEQVQNEVDQKDFSKIEKLQLGDKEKQLGTLWAIVRKGDRAEFDEKALQEGKKAKARFDRKHVSAGGNEGKSTVGQSDEEQFVKQAKEMIKAQREQKKTNHPSAKEMHTSAEQQLAYEKTRKQVIQVVNESFGKRGIASKGQQTFSGSQNGRGFDDYYAADKNVRDLRNADPKERQVDVTKFKNQGQDTENVNISYPYDGMQELINEVGRHHDELVDGTPPEPAQTKREPAAASGVSNAPVGGKQTAKKP